MSAGAGVAVEIVSGGGCRVRGTIAVWVASSKARPESTIKMRVDPLDNYWTRWVGGRQSTPHKEPSRLVEGSDGWKMRKRAEGFSGCFIDFFALSCSFIRFFVSSFIYFSSLANQPCRSSQLYLVAPSPLSAEVRPSTCFNRSDSRSKMASTSPQASRRAGAVHCKRVRWWSPFWSSTWKTAKYAPHRTSP